MPGTSPAAPSVLVIDRSAVGFNVSVSVAVLFAAAGSVMPAATATVAVFANVPVAVEAIVAVSVNVAMPLGSRSTVVLMLPEPEAGHVDPAEAVHVHVAPERLAGTVSVTVVAMAADGPAFDATIVYVTVDPGIAVALPSVLVIDTSARRVIVVVSVAELFAGFGSVAELETVPVAVDSTVALTVNVTEPPERTLTEAEMLPEPEAGQLEPADAVHVHVTPERLAGMVSETVALVMADGPAFEATTVYVNDVPALIEARPSVLEIDRSAVGVNESVSVATLLAELVSTAPAGAVIVTELASEPVAVDDTVTTTV